MGKVIVVRNVAKNQDTNVSNMKYIKENKYILICIFAIIPLLFYYYIKTKKDNILHINDLNKKNILRIYDKLIPYEYIESEWDVKIPVNLKSKINRVLFVEDNTSLSNLLGLSHYVLIICVDKDGRVVYKERGNT